MLNNLRREAIESLDKKRLERTYLVNEKIPFVKKIFNEVTPSISVSVKTMEQYLVAKELGIDFIDFNCYLYFI